MGNSFAAYTEGMKKAKLELGLISIGRNDQNQLNQ